MADPRTRDRIVELVRQMREHTTENGCTPGEAAKFAARVARWIEEYQIEEAELRSEGGTVEEEATVHQNVLRTGKKVHNPGTTAVVNGLAKGMCCKVVLDYGNDHEAVYGIVGDEVDADYVCQIATAVVPALQVMARMEGAEHGHEKAGLVGWTNQYLIGAGDEIYKRLVAERRDRSEARELEHRASGTALVLVTGLTVAAAKVEAVEEAFKQLYPHTRTVHSRARYDIEAQERGRAAGRRVGLHVGIE